MLSNPSAMTQWWFPLCTIVRANNKAQDPVEQLLLVLKMGIPVIPWS
jgi:hypothetical protein